MTSDEVLDSIKPFDLEGLRCVPVPGEIGARVAGMIEFIESRISRLKQNAGLGSSRIRELADAEPLPTGPKMLGNDVIIEATGLPATFKAAVEEVAFAGRVVYIGYAKELVAYETRLFVQKALDILGSRNALPIDFQAVIQMLEQHRFPVEGAISTVVPIEQAPEIFRAWCDNPAQFSKIVISMQ
jgi:threonine dehydrogenase-like Zn-dependent dehydrogenase